MIKIETVFPGGAASTNEALKVRNQSTFRHKQGNRKITTALQSRLSCTERLFNLYIWRSRDEDERGGFSCITEPPLLMSYTGAVPLTHG